METFLSNAILSGYRVHGRRAFFTNIPIEYLEEFKKRFGGIKMRIRYRGPRVGLDNRSWIQQRQDCRKKFAKTFSVYIL